MSEENKSALTERSPLSILFQGLGRNLIFRGILEVAVGLLLLFSPARTIRILIVVIGVLLILDGVGLFLASLRAGSVGKRFAVINASVLVFFGAMTICSPLFMEYLWILILGVWLIVTSISELLGGGWRRIWGIASSLLSLIVGVTFILMPFASVEAIAMIAGGVLTASGILTFCAGVDMRAASRRI
ncbi:MAG: DUF308 domain-containing protein [Lentisphaeria bacterium]|nr:DUF308 domain-containing protein [Lentisphaeria bacterium]